MKKALISALILCASASAQVVYNPKTHKIDFVGPTGPTGPQGDPGAISSITVAGTANIITVTGTSPCITSSCSWTFTVPALIATTGTLALTNGTTIVGPSASGTLSTIAGVETLTNKTLTTPTIGSFSNANHDHSNSAGGGNLTSTAVGSGNKQGTGTKFQMSTGTVTSGICAEFDATGNVVNAASGLACGSGGGGGTPGGTNGQIQYNNAGSFGGFTPSTFAQKGNGTGGLTDAASTDLTDTADLIRNTDTATVTNTMLENPSTTVNGQNCILGSTCTITAGTGDQPAYAASTCSSTSSLDPTSNVANTFKITLSGNCTSSFANPPNTGQRLTFQVCQAGVGGPYTFAWPTGFSTAPTVSPIASACTSFTGVWNGSAIAQEYGADSGPLIFTAEAAAPGTPPSGFDYCWPDSTDHAGLQCKANNSSVVFKMVKTGVDVNPVTGQVTATHLASALPPAQGGTGVQTITGVLVGNGTGAFTAVSGSGTDCVLVNGTSASCSGGGGGGSNVGFSPSVETVVSASTTSVTVTLNTTLTSATQAWPSCFNSSRVGQMADSWSVNAGLTTMTINFVPTAAFSGSCTAIVVSSEFIYVGVGSGAPAPAGGTPLALFTDATDSGTCTGGGTPGTYAICAWNGAAWTATSGAGGGGGANTALSNLSSVSINVALLPQTGVDLGSTTKNFREIFFGNGTFGSTYLKLTGVPTSTRTVTFPDLTGTAVVAATSTTTTQFMAATSTAGAPAFRAIVAGDLPTTLTSGTAITNAALTTPTLGVATATTINKVTITAPASASTLTVDNGKTLRATNTLTLTGTDSTVMTFPTTSATIARTDAANTFTGVQTMSSAALTTPKVITSIVDTNANTIIGMNPTASAVDYLQVTNGAAGSPGIVDLAAIGSDTNISITLTPKGSGTVNIGGAVGSATLVEGTAPSGVASSDILFAASTGNRFKMINNNGTADTVVGAATTDTFTGKTLDVSGSGNVIALSAINPQTTTYQVLAADFTGYKTISVASGTFTITLVASGSQPAAGRYIRVINYGSGVVTIARSGQNINGGTSSLSLAAGSATSPTEAFIQSDGTNYFASKAASGAGSGCGPAGSATQVLTDDGAGACTSNAAFTYSAGVATLGTAGSVVGKLAMANATSGTITLAPTTGALVSTVATFPVVTGTVMVGATSTTTTQALFATSTAGAPAFRALAAADLPATLTSGTAITNAALTTAVLTGLPTGTGVASAATASTLASRDASANLSANSMINGYTTTATAAGTTTLTVASTKLQYFTGSTTQTVVLPVTSTMVLGEEFEIVNNSTGAVTVQSSGANAIVILAGGTKGTFTVILTSGTSAASWSFWYSGSAITSAKKLSISNTLTLAGTDSTTMTFPSTSATIARTDAANTFTGHQTIEGVTSTGATGTGNFAFSASPTFTGTLSGAAATFTGILTALADFSTGTTKTFSLGSGYFECTGTCTITMPVPAAGQQFCVRNANNIATVITFAAIGSSARYENTASTAYGTAGTGTLVSGGAAGDKMCLVGKDSTHFDIFSYNGSWTAN